MQDKECGGGKQQVPKQLSKTTKNETEAEKAVQSASLPLPLTVPCWAGGLSPLGYMGQVPSLQSVVSMDGSTRSSTALQPPHFVLAQSRPKQCATHFYIAQNIYCLQQFARMNPFWHPVAGSAPLYGTKPYNLNAVPATESTMVSNPLQGSFVVDPKHVFWCLYTAFFYCICVLVWSLTYWSRSCCVNKPANTSNLQSPNIKKTQVIYFRV
ncbi:protein TIME FOR COFFEE-like [Tasmannia lanceolata]|uniref:protein TIME FOR COFFEE-like n=1 Tax=Tasmannia lanceolata TaxID=3420 RepID=UPI004062AFD3